MIEFLHPRSLKFLSYKLQSLISKHLWAKILLAGFLGVMTGMVLSPEAALVPSRISAPIVSWLAFPGQLFLGLIQMVILPLVFASVIRGIAASEDIDQLRSLGLRAGIYFVITTAVSIVIGIVIASFIKPGEFIDEAYLSKVFEGTADQMDPEKFSLPSRTVPEAIIGLLPDNPFAIMVDGQMFQIVLFAIILGVAMVTLKPDVVRPLLSLFGAIQEVCLTIVGWAMWLAPFAVFGLLAKITSTVGVKVLLGMTVYMGTVVLGLFLVLLMFIILAATVGRCSVGKFLSSLRELQLLAFSTSSSAAVMPLTIRTTEEKLGVRSSVAQFLVPVGATVNMNGTALYQGVATVFLAQVFGVDLSISALAIVVMTAVGASIGSPGTPGVGILVLGMILQGVGIPYSGIALIIGVDRVLDMLRTVVNVSGDVTACLVMDRLVGGKVSADEHRRRQNDLEQEYQKLGDNVITKPIEP